MLAWLASSVNCHKLCECNTKDTYTCQLTTKQKHKLVKRAVPHSRAYYSTDIYIKMFQKVQRPQTGLEDAVQ